MGNLSVSLHGQLTTATGTFCNNHWAKTVSQYCFLSKAPIAVSISQDFYNKSSISSSNLTQRNAVSSCGWKLNWGKTQHGTAENTVQWKTSFQDQGKEQELFALSFSLSLCSVPNRRCKVAISLFATRLWFLSDVFVGCNFFLWLLDQNSDVLQVVISFFGCLIRILMHKQVVIFSFFVQDQSSDIYLHVTFLSVDLCFAFAAEVLQFYGFGFCCICRQMRRLNIQ